jgi:hypothetical protein
MTFFDYQDHHSTHNGQFLFTCEKCTQVVFRNRGDLLDHESKHKISCHICSLQVLPKSMSAHLLIHTDIYKYVTTRKNSNCIFVLVDVPSVA